MVQPNKLDDRKIEDAAFMAAKKIETNLSQIASMTMKDAQDELFNIVVEEIRTLVGIPGETWIKNN
jgi:hypothetical protein